MQRKVLLISWVFLGWLISNAQELGYNGKRWVTGVGLNFSPIVNSSKVPSSASGINLRYFADVGYVVNDNGLLTAKIQYLNTPFFIDQSYRYINNAYTPYQAQGQLNALEFAFGGKVFGLTSASKSFAPKGWYLQFEMSRFWYNATYNDNKSALVSYNVPDPSVSIPPVGKTFKRGDALFHEGAWGFDCGVGYHFIFGENFLFDLGTNNGYIYQDINTNADDITSEEVAAASASRRLFNVHFWGIYGSFKFLF